jgi:hypothetical protein
MDRETKAFILASLSWLLLGVSLGVVMTFQLGNYALLRFAHLHLLLLGFMAMMVYGVGYFILPRFNGTTLRWPQLVAVHFWVSNLGLLGLVFGAVEFRPGFALISALGVLLFVVNLGATLLGAAPLQQRLSAKDAALAVQSVTPAGTSTMSPAATGSGGAPQLSGHETIGEVLAHHPQLEDTIRLFFGDGCFSCPGQSTESLIQAAAVHNIDPDLLLDALRKRL